MIGVGLRSFIMKSKRQMLPILIALSLPAVAAYADDNGQVPAPAPAAEPGQSSSTTSTTTTTSQTTPTPAFVAPGDDSASFPTIGFSVGTRALDLELGYSVSPYFGVRLVGADMNVPYKTMRNDISYKGHYDFQSLSLLGDWYPGGGAFRFTAGAVYDKDRIKAHVEPGSNGVVVVNNVPLLPGDQVYADGRFPNQVVPYLGIGFGNPGAHHEGVGFTADLGAMYVQHPTVTLTAVGPGSGNALTQAAVQQEQGNLNADLRKINVFPVASLGVYYGF
jgi:hypothetical protein